MTKLLAILKIDEVYVIPINRSNHITETFFENPGHRCFLFFHPICWRLWFHIVDTLLPRLTRMWQRCNYFQMIFSMIYIICIKSITLVVVIQPATAMALFCHSETNAVITFCRFRSTLIHETLSRIAQTLNNCLCGWYDL